MQTDVKEPYGLEVAIDLHNCDTSLFNRKDLKRLFRSLCSLIGVTAKKLTWWDYHWWPKMFRTKDPKLYGTSAVQFIMTSNITVHALDKLGHVYLNVFSCDQFDAAAVALFVKEFFGGDVIRVNEFERI